MKKLIAFLIAFVVVFYSLAPISLASSAPSGFRNILDYVNKEATKSDIIKLEERRPDESIGFSGEYLNQLIYGIPMDALYTFSDEKLATILYSSVKGYTTGQSIVFDYVDIKESMSKDLGAPSSIDEPLEIDPFSPSICELLLWDFEDAHFSTLWELDVASVLLKLYRNERQLSITILYSLK